MTCSREPSAASTHGLSEEMFKEDPLTMRLSLSFYDRVIEARARLAVRLWWWARKLAIRWVTDAFPYEVADARSTWNRDARWAGALAEPGYWNPGVLGADLALHDAADHLLGENE